MLFKYLVNVTYKESVYLEGDFQYYSTEASTLIPVYNSYTFSTTTGARLYSSGGTSQISSIALGMYFQRNNQIYKVTSSPFWIWTLPDGTEVFKFYANVYSSSMISNKGSLFESNVQGTLSEYPSNGVHTDGYWYVRKSLVN